MFDRIAEEAAGYLGEGIAQLINLFNVEMILFAGRVSQVDMFCWTQPGEPRSRIPLLSFIEM